MKKTKLLKCCAIIIPVYNEEKIITNVLDRLLIEAEKLSADIFVVNDGSTDGTFKKLKSFGNKISIISYRENRGKGYALRKATDKVHKKYDIIAWMDGDGQLLASDIIKMMAVLSDDTDMIISNRIINFKVLPTSKIGRGTVRWLFNTLFKSKISDHLSGLRVFRSTIYSKIRWISNDYRIEVETLARAVVNNVKFKETKTICKKKLYRGIGWKDGLKIYYWIIWCRINKKKILYHKIYKYGQNYTNVLTKTNKVRKFIRRHIFIKNILKFVEGNVVDFGCGTGEVLKFLPTDSVGFDINKSSIKHCQKNKLNACFYDLKKDQYMFSMLKKNKFQILLLNHVLEHLPNPKKTLLKIIKSSKRLGIKRIIIVVPGKKGFKADETHIEHINNEFFENKLKTTDYKIIHKKHHPINNKIIGNIFRYQELVVVYERIK